MRTYKGRIVARRRAFRLDTDENAYFGTARRHSCPLYNSHRRIKSSSSRFEAPACTTASLGGQISRRDATCSKPELIRKSVALPLREILRFERRSSHCASRRRPAQRTIVRSGIGQFARRIYASSSTQDSRSSSLVLRLSLREVWFASAQQSGCSKPSKPDQGLLASFATRDRTT